jgi:hypothetical protein
MQHSWSEEDDIRRLERVRLLAAAREPRLAMQLGYASLHDMLRVPFNAQLQSPLASSGLYYPPSLAGSTLGLATHPSLLHRLPPPLPISVTRGFVQGTGSPVGLEYNRTINANEELTGKLPASSTHHQDVTPYSAEDIQARYDNERELPPSFKPGPNSVIIGRKKNCYTSVGNLRLRDICLMRLPAYSKCTKKKDKSEIVTDVVKLIRDSCPAGVAFVKRDSAGRWSEVKDVVARERVASIFRDFLHDQYRSSSKSKVAKRREMRVTHYMKPPGAEEEGSTVKEEGKAEDVLAETREKKENNNDESGEDSVI